MIGRLALSGFGGLPSVALVKEGGKSGLHRVGRPGVVLGDFVFKHKGRKVPQKTDRFSLLLV